MAFILTDKTRLSTAYPNIAQEWDLDKNYPLIPEDISCSSKKTVYWKCKKCKSVWAARINHRVYDGTGCPKCPKIYFRKQSLAESIPEIHKIWHPTKNNISPDRLGRSSDKKAWFICDKGHEWEAAIYSVYSNYKKGNSGCPYCKGLRVDENSCLSKIYPKIAKEWHPIKNGPLTPDDVGKGSTKIVWWKCDKKHEWKTSITIRTSQQTQCPYCVHSKLSSENNLAVKYPDIARLWHPTLNGSITPFQVTTKTHDSYWWKCPKGHEWKTRVGHLVNGVSSCPVCSRVVLEDGSSFMSLVEAFWYLKFKQLGLKFICDGKYPGNQLGRRKYDFYFPSINLYVEVTGYGKEWKHWKRYSDNILKKRSYVENQLTANFCFISQNISDTDRAFVRKNIKTY
jgi:hypothetical protein